MVSELSRPSPVALAGGNSLVVSIASSLSRFEVFNPVWVWISACNTLIWFEVSHFRIEASATLFRYRPVAIAILVQQNSVTFQPR
jgi:hypothetical protein